MAASTSLFLFASLLLKRACSLDNGAAPLPILGWSSWNTFGCQINETLIKQTIDAMVSSGLRDAGWEYVAIDDCWTACADRNPKHGNYCLDASPGRSTNGSLRADPTLFPSGMSSLSAYAHDNGLKFGIYTSFGEKTCGGYVGSLGHEAQDAATFASWGVDFVKHDFCDCNASVAITRAPIMRDAMNATGRRMVYYVDVGAMVPRVFGGPLVSHPGSPRAGKTVTRPEDLPWAWGPSTANMWKTWHDIGNGNTKVWPLRCDWKRVMENLDHNVGHGQVLAQQAGAYNFPDMLAVGNPGCSFTEWRAQFSLWVALGTPLLLGHDLRSMSKSDSVLDFLTNLEALAITRDPLALPGSKVRDLGDIEIFVKPLSVLADTGSLRYAVALLNRADPSKAEAGIGVDVDFCNDFDPYGICNGATQAKVRDIVARSDVGTFRRSFHAEVAPHDVRLFVVTPIQTEIEL